MKAPARGEIWLLDLGKTRGRAQAGARPGLVVSVDPFNQSGADLVIVLPITSRAKGIRSHVPVRPPEGGLSLPSFIKCEDVRSVSKQRLHKQLGTIHSPTMQAVEDRLRILLGL